jgi:hypothetical protein
MDKGLLKGLMVIPIALLMFATYRNLTGYSHEIIFNNGASVMISSKDKDRTLCQEMLLVRKAGADCFKRSGRISDLMGFCLNTMYGMETLEGYKLIIQIRNMDETLDFCHRHFPLR